MLLLLSRQRLCLLAVMVKVAMRRGSRGGNVSSSVSEEKRRQCLLDATSYLFAAATIFTTAARH
jgi:hypothetical protein